MADHPPETHFGGLSIRDWALLWSAVLGIAVVVSLFAGFPEAQVCRNEGQPPHENCSTHHVLLVALLRVWRVIDANQAPILAVTTVMLALLTYGLWRSAQQTAALMERTASAQLRAYVVVETIGVESQMAYRRMKWQLLLRNTGNTPARKVRIVWRVMCEGIDIEGFKNKDATLNKGSIGGNSFLAHEAEGVERFPDEVYPKIAARKGGGRAVLVGKVTYLDVNGDWRETTILRRAKFDYRGQPVGDEPDPSEDMT